MAYPGRQQHMSDWDRMKRLMTVPRPLRKFMLCQLLVALCFLFLWYHFNGGLVPWFLRHRFPTFQIGPETPTLLFFSKAENDGSKIKWAHAANSQSALTTAMNSDIQMIEADVMLRGQGTNTQSLVPVMAQLPATDGDMTLNDWLNKVVAQTEKGFKLDFQSTDSVEISLQKLNELKPRIKVPMWLHGDVLQGPHGDKPLVNPARFIRTIKRLFPTCTLSLGWTTGTSTDLSQSGYTWDMVLDMYNLVKQWEVDQPIVFSIRSNVIHNSVIQLKWLVDNIRASSILVWHHPGDTAVGQDLAYISFRFPPHNSFFDLNHKDLETFLQQYRHFSKEKVHHLVLERDTVAFRPDAWVKMGLYIEEHSILPSTEALVLSSRAVYIVSKTKYKPVEQLKLIGRVQFLNRKKVPDVPGETGLNIYLRPTSYTDFEHIVGIRCFLGTDGQLKVTPSHLLADDFTKSARITPSSSNCYRFSVTDTFKEVIMTVNVLHNCDTLESTKPDEEVHAVLKVKIPESVGLNEHPYILKLEDSKRTAVIDELTTHYNFKRDMKKKPKL